MLGTSLSHLRYLKWNSNLFLSKRFHRNILIFRALYYHSAVCSFNLNFSDLLSVRKILHKNLAINYSQSSKTKCWNCNKNLVDILKFSCSNCGVLQEPDPDMNYFDLMNLEQNFDLNVDDISFKYKTLQMLFHPDKFVQKSKEELDISDTYSRLVNKAYSTLKNPLSRGMYILSLNGIDAGDESVKMDQKFLMDILEKNEELENINDEESLKKMFETNSKVISDFVSVASKAFQANDLMSAREALMRMKYFVNIENEIKKKKSEMGIVD